MKIENNIGWCDATVNAVTGCQEISEGCDNCYARTSTRARVLRHGPLKIETWGPKGQRVPVKAFALKVRALNKKTICTVCNTAHIYPQSGILGTCLSCGAQLRKIRLFADSTSDWLDIQWPAETLVHYLDEITQATNLHIQMLTKRPQLWVKRMKVAIDHCRKVKNERLERVIGEWLEGKAPRHLWIGTSIENNKQRMDRLSNILAIPAAVRFISVEPLLEGLSLNPPIAWNDTVIKIHWVIVGGESGPKRRDCGVKAITDVADQCVAAGVPIYVKQDCAQDSGEQGRIPDEYWRLKQMPKV